MPPNYTVGVNYTILSNLSVYGRYADSYQTGGENAEPAEIKLYEAGVTYAGYGVIGTVRGFRTLFNHQSFGGGVDPDNANLTQGFFANSDTNGVDIDVNYRPTFEVLHAVSIHGQLTYQKTAFNNVSTGVITVNGQNIASQVATFYDGKATPQTPSLLYTITHQRRRGRLRSCWPIWTAPPPRGRTTDRRRCFPRKAVRMRRSRPERSTRCAATGPWRTKLLRLRPSATSNWSGDSGMARAVGPAPSAARTNMTPPSPAPRLRPPHRAEIKSC